MFIKFSFLQKVSPKYLIHQSALKTQFYSLMPLAFNINYKGNGQFKKVLLLNIRFTVTAHPEIAIRCRLFKLN